MPTMADRCFRSYYALYYVKRAPALTERHGNKKGNELKETLESYSSHLEDSGPRSSSLIGRCVGRSVGATKNEIEQMTGL